MTSQVTNVKRSNDTDSTNKTQDVIQPEACADIPWLGDNGSKNVTKESEGKV